MAIENVRHPIKDTVKADNSTYSSNKIESLIHSATELPETSVADAGDVLMVNDEGEWDKGEIIVPQELPTPATADIGKIVSVVSDGDEGAEYGLENAPTEVPVPTSADKYKVISVNYSGNYVLTTPFDERLIPGIIQNGAILSNIVLPETAGSLNISGDILALVDLGNSNTAVYFRKAYETSGASGITTFSAITYESSKVYYHELKIGYTATSIPANTPITKVQIG